MDLFRFSLDCLGWAQREQSMPGRVSVSQRSKQSLTKSTPHEPPIGQTLIFVRCTSGCAKSGRVFLTAIRTVLESGPAHSDNMGPYYQTKFWFRDHLNAKGIPYDDAILDEVCGVNYEKLMNKMLDDAVHGRRRRRWF